MTSFNETFLNRMMNNDGFILKNGSLKLLDDIRIKAGSIEFKTTSSPNYRRRRRSNFEGQWKSCRHKKILLRKSFQQWNGKSNRNCALIKWSKRSRSWSTMSPSIIIICINFGGNKRVYIYIYTTTFFQSRKSSHIFESIKF